MWTGARSPCINIVDNVSLLGIFASASSALLLLCISRVSSTLHLHVVVVVLVDFVAA